MSHHYISLENGYYNGRIISNSLLFEVRLYNNWHKIILEIEFDTVIQTRLVQGKDVYLICIFHIHNWQD